MARVLCAALLCGVLSAQAAVLFSEDFSSGKAWESASKDGLGVVAVKEGKYKKDAGLQTTQDAKFYAASTSIPKISNKDKTLVFSFSVTHEQNIDCGGGYLKLMPAVDAASFNGDSKYYVMFGPDICGPTKKIHLIFHYEGKNLLWKKEPRAEGDELTHFYTLVLNADNTYEVLVDNEKKESGKLEEDWEFLLPKEIDDPSDKKPADWVDDAEIVDPEDKKPEDWDKESEQIVDPEASKPEDWDDEEDGDWEAPMIPNPKFKGEWKAKMIPNPAYKGVWAPKKIANPDYKEDSNLYLFEDIAALGLDVWQVKAGTIFDNILVSDDAADAEASFKAYADKLSAEKEAKEAAAKAEEEAAKAAASEKSDAAASEGDDEDEEDDKDEL